MYTRCFTETLPRASMSPGILSRVMKSFVLSTSLDRLSIGQSSNVCSQFPKHPGSSENGSLEGDDTGDRENLPTRLPGWICWKTVTGHSFSAIDREVEPLNSVTFQQRSFCRAQIGEQAGWETTGMKKTWRRDGDTDPAIVKSYEFGVVSIEHSPPLVPGSPGYRYVHSGSLCLPLAELFSPPRYQLSRLAAPRVKFSLLRVEFCGITIYLRARRIKGR